MNNPTKALTERQHYWLNHLRACEQAGQGMKAYALSQGLNIKTLYTWKKTLVKKGVLPRTRPVRFQKAQIMGAVTTSEWRIQLPNGVAVAFSGSVDAGTLGTVLKTAVAV